MYFSLQIDLECVLLLCFYFWYCYTYYFTVIFIIFITSCLYIYMHCLCHWLCHLMDVQLQPSGDGGGRPDRCSTFVETLHLGSLCSSAGFWTWQCCLGSIGFHWIMSLALVRGYDSSGLWVLSAVWLYSVFPFCIASYWLLIGESLVFVIELEQFTLHAHLTMLIIYFSLLILVLVLHLTFTTCIYACHYLCVCLWFACIILYC